MTDSYYIEKHTANLLDINYLSGVEIFDVYYSERYDKVIYLLGETHTTKGRCNKDDMGPKDIIINGNDFVFKLLDDNPEHIFDVFIEEHFMVSELELNIKKESCIDSDNKDCSYLEILRSKINRSGCVGKKSDCDKYKKQVRFHFADTRITDITVFDFLSDILHYSDRFSTLEDALKKPGYFKYNTADNIRKDIAEALKSTKTNKQLENIPKKYENVKDILNEEMRLILNDESIGIITIPNLTKVMNELKTDVYRNTKLHNYLVEGEVTHLTSRMMDIYLISRMFRSFKDVKGKISIEPKNIIIYTGSFHTESYIKLLDRIGFRSIFSAKRHIFYDKDSLTKKAIDNIVKNVMSKAINKVMRKKKADMIELINDLTDEIKIELVNKISDRISDKSLISKKMEETYNPPYCLSLEGFKPLIL